MTIVVEPETEARLRDTAQREGVDLNALANKLIDEALEQRTREFAEEVAAIKEAFDAVSQGRERPFEEFLAEHRAHYGSNTDDIGAPVQ